jgi:hypothetical protein
MKTAIAAITFAVLIAIPAYAGEYNITLKCGASVRHLETCTGPQAACLSGGGHTFDRLTQDQRRFCEVNVSRR